MTTIDNITFIFDYVNETLNGVVATGKLELEIRNNENILIGLKSSSIVGGVLVIDFKAALSANEIIAFEALINAHDGTELPDELFTRFHPDYIVNDKLKIANQFEPHNVDHVAGGVDELNVGGLSGELSDNQKPIPVKCVEAMGVKSDSNPLNHDRFQQSDISNLPESALSLNFSTHNNSNDLSTAQKQAIDSSVSPSSANPFITQSEQVPGLQGATGAQGPQGIKGDQGIQGIAGSNGTQGVQGNVGDPFTIHKTYISITAMNSDLANIVFGKFVMIDTGDINDVDTGKLYFRDVSAWAFISDLSGATGIEGPQGVAGIQGNDGANGNNGAQGIQGNDGIQGIQGVAGPAGSGGKRCITLTLVKGGNGSTGWMRLSDSGIDSRKANYTPPFDCKVREVIITSESAVNDQNNQGRIAAHYVPIGDSSDKMETSDTVEWQADSNGTNVMYRELNSQFWGYDLTTENQVMLQTRRYGFYSSRISGSRSWKDMHVQIILEEL